MIQGTSSDAGKSLIATGLCRIFSRKNLLVVPFKAQNMALNSYVTADNREMGRAQVTQAIASFKEPDVRMNPVLLKPSSDTGSQVIVKGTARSVMNFSEYKKLKVELKEIIHQCYTELASENDVVIIEGAGSPAEINLKKDEIVNMHVARLAQAPVLIVGDIDRGGVFAHFIGTWELLDPDEQKMVKGFIINKFRGDASLLQSAIEYVEERTGVPVLGTVHMLEDLNIPDEDSVSFKRAVGKKRYNPKSDINIALIDLPHISNFTDFDPFLDDGDVNIYTVNSPDHIGSPDMIILPGSKNVIGDLLGLKNSGYTKIISDAVDKGTMIVGICGGYQMLGKRINDPNHLESSVTSSEGLGYLEIETTLDREKKLSQTKAYSPLCDQELSGYEIHHGVSKVSGSKEKPFVLNKEGEVIGVRRGKVWGTYLHGIFDNNEFRREILNEIRLSKGTKTAKVTHEKGLDDELNRLADHIEHSLDMNRIYTIMGIN